MKKAQHQKKLKMNLCKGVSLRIFLCVFMPESEI
jgi:hypothetical protein